MLALQKCPTCSALDFKGVGDKMQCITIFCEKHTDQ